jgi:hypothetical protein
MKRAERISCVIVLLIVNAALVLAQEKQLREPDVIYVPTPQAVVEGMLDLAGVTAKDVVYDLGCGDGRLVVTAAKKYGARAVDVMPTGQAEGPERAPPPEAPNTAATPSSQATTDEPPARADSEDDGKAASEDAGKAASETPGEEQAGRSLPQKERKKRAPSSARPRPKKKAAAAVDDLKAPY